jgi:steroid delta-isomerase-like uncharacterized protein
MKLVAVLVLAGACASNPPHPEHSMSKTDPKLQLEAFMQAVFNRGDVAAADTFVDAAFVDHAPWPGHPGTLAGFKAGLTEIRTAFPDLKVELARVVLEGDLLVGHLTISGTQLGPYMGAPASGKTFRIEAVDILRLHDGKAVEHWGVMDVAGMSAQLGLTP